MDMHNSAQSRYAGESVQRTFWRYALPSITALAVSGLYEVIDGFFVGRHVGYEGLAAINVAWPIIFVVTGIGFLIGIGSGSLISISQGRQQPEQARRILNTSVLLLLLASLATTSLMLQFDTPLLQLQNASGNPLAMAEDYTEVFAWGSVLTLLATALPMIIRNDNRPLFATALLATGALLNIVLDYLFIAELGWGIRGAAIASIMAQGCIALVALGYFIHSRTELRLGLMLLHPQWTLVRRILLLGSSTFVMYLYTSFDVALHNHLFMAYGSPLTVGAYAIVGYLMMLYYLLAEGISDGMQPPVSYFLGARQQDKVAAVVKLAAKLVILTGLGWVALLNLFPDTITGLFSQGDNALETTATEGIRLHLFTMFLDGFIVLAAVYFTAVDQGRKALFISLGNILIQLPFLLVLPKLFGLTGIWLALPLSTLALFLVVAPMVWRDLQQRQYQPVTDG